MIKHAHSFHVSETDRVELRVRGEVFFFISILVPSFIFYETTVRSVCVLNAFSPCSLNTFEHLFRSSEWKFSFLWAFIDLLNSLMIHWRKTSAFQCEVMIHIMIMRGVGKGILLALQHPVPRVNTWQCLQSLPKSSNIFWQHIISCSIFNFLSYQLFFWRV